MERKWKIYKLICIIEFALSLLICLYFLKNWIENIQLKISFSLEFDSLDFIFFIAFCCFSIYHFLCFPSFKKYPDNEVSNGYENVFLVFFMISLILTLGMLAVFVAGMFEVISEFQNSKKYLRPILIQTICTLHILGHFYCMKNSFSLKNLINSNFNKKQEILLDSIGII